MFSHPGVKHGATGILLVKLLETSTEMESDELHLSLTAFGLAKTPL